MIILWFILAVIIGMILGGFIGFRLRHSRYDGIITMEEKDRGLVYSLVVPGDPELLANQKAARFKIIPPSYEDSRSRN